MAAHPDPLWETAISLHRFQTRLGRWAYAEWYRTACCRLRQKGLDRALSEVLLPLFPRAAYFPDFLTPAEGAEGLDAALAAIVDTPTDQVRYEIRRFAETATTPSWLTRLVEQEKREELTHVLRAYYEAVISPYGDRVQARIDAERASGCRALLDGGMERLLSGLGPTMRWEAPFLYVDYPAENRDLFLGGRGLRLVPSYFCWGAPIALANPALQPVLVYPLSHQNPSESADARRARTWDHTAKAPLTSLLGRTRAVVLHATVDGATTGELGRRTGISASAASRHATALRDAGLISSHRHAATVLHTLTPLGASLLRASGRNDRGASSRRLV
jgi:DNA-binding transcriptional ArsR family regulator